MGRQPVARRACFPAWTGSLSPSGVPDCGARLRMGPFWLQWILSKRLFLAGKWWGDQASQQGCSPVPAGTSRADMPGSKEEGGGTAIRE